MTRLTRPSAWVAVAAALSIVGWPLPEAQAQARSRGQARASVRQSRHYHPRPPHARPPVYRPPSRPPGYRPPPHVRPPVYRPRPPRYRGYYYPSYSAWRAVAGVAAVIAIGTILASPPPKATTVVVKETTYYVHDGVYYQEVVHGDGVAYQCVPKP